MPLSLPSQYSAPPASVTIASSRMTKVMPVATTIRRPRWRRRGAPFADRLSCSAAIKTRTRSRSARDSAIPPGRRRDRGSPARSACANAGRRHNRRRRRIRTQDRSRCRSRERGERIAVADPVLVFEAPDCEIASADDRAAARDAERLERVAAQRLDAAGPEQVLARDVVARARADRRRVRACRPTMPRSKSVLFGRGSKRVTEYRTARSCRSVRIPSLAHPRFAR